MLVLSTQVTVMFLLYGIFHPSQGHLPHFNSPEPMYTIGCMVKSKLRVQCFAKNAAHNDPCQGWNTDRLILIFNLRALLYLNFWLSMTLSFISILQGINLDSADLSKLDLRFINFKMANLRKTDLAHANLSNCCLERANLSGAHMDVSSFKSD